jgi:WD40 repeat protein
LYFFIFFFGKDDIVYIEKLKKNIEIFKLKSHYFLIAYLLTTNMLALKAKLALNAKYVPTTDSIFKVAVNFESDVNVRLDITADGSYIISHSDDFLTRIWDPKTGVCICTLAEHEHPVMVVAFNKQSSLVTITTRTGDISVWNTTTGKRQRNIYITDNSVVNDIIMTADGSKIIAAFENNPIFIVDTQKRYVEYELETDDSINTIRLSLNETLLVSGGQDHTVCVWDFLTHERIHVLEGHDDWVIEVKISNDCRRIASISLSNCMIVWDTFAGVSLYKIDDLQFGISTVAFNFDGSRIAIGNDRVIKVWDTETGENLKFLRKHRAAILSIVSYDNVGYWNRHFASLPQFEDIKANALTVIALGNRYQDRYLLPKEIWEVVFQFLMGKSLMMSISEDRTALIWNVAF